MLTLLLLSHLIRPMILVFTVWLGMSTNGFLTFIAHCLQAKFLNFNLSVGIHLQNTERIRLQANWFVMNLENWLKIQSPITEILMMETINHRSLKAMTGTHKKAKQKQIRCTCNLQRKVSFHRSFRITPEFTKEEAGKTDLTGQVPARGDTDLK